MSAFNPAVTDARPFCQPDKLPLFTVNAGVPVQQALEQASHLLACLENLTQTHGTLDECIEHVLLQSVTEMTRALVDSCQAQDPEVFQYHLRRAEQARAEALARVTPQTPAAKATED